MATCESCRRTKRNIGNTYGKAHKGRSWDRWKGKSNPRHKQDMNGEKHHNWNPNKTAYKKYLYKVQRLTEANYKLHKDQINPSDLPRRLCGEAGGYQLDHIVSVKKGFTMGINPIHIAAPTNLQMLPWLTNRSKWHR